MGVGMDIIVARDSHIPGIMELLTELLQFHRDIDPRFPLNETAPSALDEHLRDILSDKDSIVFITLKVDKIVGFSIARIMKSVPIWQREYFGLIDTVMVSSDYRRQDVGTKMLNLILEWFASRDIDMVELSVAAGNQVGRSFWKKHGFREYLHRLYLKI